MSNENATENETETATSKIPRKVLALILSLGTVENGIYSVDVAELEALVSDRTRTSVDDLRPRILALLKEAGFEDPAVSAMVCPARMILGHGLPPSAVTGAGYWRGGLSAAAQYVIDDLGLVPVRTAKINDDGSQIATVTFYRPNGKHAVTLANLRKEGALAREKRDVEKASKAAAEMHGSTPRPAIVVNEPAASVDEE